MGTSKPSNSLLESKIRRIVRKVLKEESTPQKGDTIKVLGDRGNKPLQTVILLSNFEELDGSNGMFDAYAKTKDGFLVSIVHTGNNDYEIDGGAFDGLPNSVISKLEQKYKATIF